jgi:hypothetical protein
VLIPEQLPYLAPHHRGLFLSAAFRRAPLDQLISIQGSKAGSAADMLALLIFSIAPVRIIVKAPDHPCGAFVFQLSLAICLCGMMRRGSGACWLAIVCSSSPNGLSEPQWLPALSS